MLTDGPEIDLTDAGVLRDPFTAYGRVRERAPVARLVLPGMPPMWVVLRYGEARALLNDPAFEINAGSFMRGDIAEEYLSYMRSMAEMGGQDHLRLRRLVAPAFAARRAEEYRPRVERVVHNLLDDLAEHVVDGAVDLLPHFARPLPMDVICEVVGIAEADRPRWREYGAAIAAGAGAEFTRAIPGIIDGARAALARRRSEPRDDVLSDLIRARDEDGDRLDDVEMVTLVWQLVLAGQTPTNFIVNAVAALLSHPDQLAALRADHGLVPGAVDELMRWCGPALLAIPRYAKHDVDFAGVRIAQGEAVTVSLAAANRDPRVFADPDRLDVTRPAGPPGHLGFSHGPHFCLGASLARVQSAVALTALLDRFPGMTPAGEPERAPDGGTWRLTALPISPAAPTT